MPIISIKQVISDFKAVKNRVQFLELIKRLSEEGNELPVQAIISEDFVKQHLGILPLSVLSLLPKVLQLNPEDHYSFVSQCVGCGILNIKKEDQKCDALDLITRGLSNQQCREIYIMAHQLNQEQLAAENQESVLALQTNIFPEEVKKLLKNKEKLRRFYEDKVQKYSRSQAVYQLDPALRPAKGAAEILFSEARDILSYSFNVEDLIRKLQKLANPKKGFPLGQKLPAQAIIEKVGLAMGSLHLDSNAYPMLADLLQLTEEQYFTFVKNCAKDGALSIAESSKTLYEMTERLSDEQWKAVQTEVNNVERARIAKKQLELAVKLILDNKSNIQPLLEAIEQDRFCLMKEEAWQKVMSLKKFPNKHLPVICEKILNTIPPVHQEETEMHKESFDAIVVAQKAKLAEKIESQERVRAATLAASAAPTSAASAAEALTASAAPTSEVKRYIYAGFDETLQHPESEDQPTVSSENKAASAQSNSAPAAAPKKRGRSPQVSITTLPTSTRTSSSMLPTAAEEDLSDAIIDALEAGLKLQQQNTQTTK